MGAGKSKNAVSKDACIPHLWGSPPTRSVRIHWLLTELNVKFNVTPVVSELCRSTLPYCLTAYYHLRLPRPHHRPHHTLEQSHIQYLSFITTDACSPFTATYLVHTCDILFLLHRTSWEVRCTGRRSARSALWAPSLPTEMVPRVQGSRPSQVRSKRGSDDRTLHAAPGALTASGPLHVC